MSEKEKVCSMRLCEKHFPDEESFVKESEKIIKQIQNKTLDAFVAEAIKIVEEKEGEWVEYENLIDDDISDNPTMNVLMEIRHELEQTAKRMKGEV